MLRPTSFISLTVGGAMHHSSLQRLIIHPYGGVAWKRGKMKRVKKTGGHDGRTYTGKVAKRCNRIVRDSVTRSAFHLGFQGPEDLMADYKSREASGQHADFGIGRRYLRMAMCLMRTLQVYLPKRLRNKKVIITGWLPNNL